MSWEDNPDNERLEPQPIKLRRTSQLDVYHKNSRKTKIELINKLKKDADIVKHRLDHLNGLIKKYESIN